MSTISITCSRCGKASDAEIYTSINVADNPELKARVLDGSLFVHECPFCGTANLVKGDLLYHDPEARLLICLSSRTIAAVDGLEGYICRQVSDVGSLIEKVKIFDAGLDDMVLELCKFVTLQELGKKVDLKFLKMDGADGELTLAYPENGQMQMIAVGFNVYEDCRGILQRNPVLTRSATGLAQIDQGWVEQFMK